ncbi:hypothetical protein O181_034058 [Austropuccinia psidii MF-1]|uniref:Uncharacterized protein n=1 Tax=Austropuccinia psidii MF-1 TaxID=1389203 RepID=A0A9Q3D2P7_9BASI|nr:hypothetical protein [Austropuccinia psidii MF-1]
MIVRVAFCNLIKFKLILMIAEQQQTIDLIKNAYEPGLLPFMDKLVAIRVAENQEDLILREDGASSILPFPAMNGERHIKSTSSFGLPTHQTSTQSTTFSTPKQ